MQKYSWNLVLEERLVTARDVNVSGVFLVRVFGGLVISYAI